MQKQTTHLYEYSVDPDSTSAGAHVVHFVGAEKRVLEIGCGPGSITRILAGNRRCTVTGMELDPDAIEKVKPFCDAVIRADLNDPQWPALLAGRAPFDVVVAADVLEHLYDPWETLKRMATLIRPDGHLVLSLPHVGHAAVMSCLINSNFQYRDWGLLDKTHIRFFGLRNIEELFAQAQLKITDYRYVVKLPEETEFAAHWASLPLELQRALRGLGHTSIYQVVVKAVPLQRPGAALNLSGLDSATTERGARRSATSLKNRVRATLSHRLNRRAKDKIRILLQWFKVKL